MNVKNGHIATLVFLAYCMTAATTFAQGNSNGPKSPVVVGHVLSANEDAVVVQQSGTDHQRKLTITAKTKIVFVGFKGTGKPTDVPKKGFGVKAKVSTGDVLKSIHYTPPLPANREIKDRQKLTEAELFRAADLNRNDKVDYIEFSISIHRSEKHGPDHFPNLDKDGDDTLGFKEFQQALTSIDWWRLSRKSAEEWMRTSDRDGNSELNKTEFASVCLSGSHLDQIFKRTDKDRSGTISLSELETWLGSVISPKRKRKK